MHRANNMKYYTSYRDEYTSIIKLTLGIFQNGTERFGWVALILIELIKMTIAATTIVEKHLEMKRKKVTGIDVHTASMAFCILGGKSMLKQFQQWLTEEGKTLKTIDSHIKDVSQYRKCLDEKLGQHVLLSFFTFYSTSNIFWIKSLQSEPSQENQQLESLQQFPTISNYVDDRYISLNNGSSHNCIWL